MCPNKVKIISDPNLNELSFFYRNDTDGKWRPVSRESPLSRLAYTTCDLLDAGDEIISIIDHLFNNGGRGVDIQFEGPEAEFQHLQACVSRRSPNRDIRCLRQKTVIAVAGKVGAGKTTLIQEMCRYMGVSFHSTKRDGYEEYVVDLGNVVWYELSGIDIGKEYMDAARDTFDRLSGEVTDFIYCLSTQKIEAMEGAFLSHVKNTYPDVKPLLLFTNYLEETDNPFMDRLSGQLDGIKILTVLAKEYRTRQGTIPAYGLDAVRTHLFEGK